jgi:hypothetical protein
VIFRHGGLFATVKYDDSSPAPGLHVKVHEVAASDYYLGQTDTDGSIDKDIRDRSQVSVPDDWRFPWQGTHLEDDPLDHPTFKITVDDDLGQSFTTPPFFYDAINDLEIILPPNFLHPPSSLDSSPSAVAERSLHHNVDPFAPGREFMVRKDGAIWAEAANGVARLGTFGQRPMAMINDTIIQIASMSKPICATALVAMIDDWTAIKSAIDGLGSTSTRDSQSLTFSLHVFTGIPDLRLGTISIPNVLAPLFASRSVARQFVSQGLIGALPTPLSDWLLRFAMSEMIVVRPVPSVPPGHFGLLRRVLQGVQPPAYGDPFLPLIESKLRATAASVGGNYQPGTGIDVIKLQELLVHSSALIIGLQDPSLQQQPGWTAAQSQQPADGSQVTFNLWPYLLLLLRQNATGAAGYKK